MSTSPEPVRAIPSDRRTPSWALLVLFLAVAGMAFSLPATSPAATAPVSPHAGPTAAALLWTPLNITSYSASPSPAFVSNLTTISVSVSGGQPFTVPAGYMYSYSGLPTGCSSANTSSLACTPTAVGNYTIIVTVTDAGGNVTKNAISLRTEGMTITSFTETPATVPLGSSASFSATYAGESGAITWTWAGLPAGCTGGNAKTLTCTPTVSGPFTVTLTGTDAALAANAKTASFTVTPVTVATFTDSPSTIYTGQSTTFTVTTSGTTSTVTYSYTGLPTASPGCVSADVTTLSCLARVAGTFTVQVTAKDTAGDTSVASTVLTVKPLTITAFQASPNPTYEFYLTTFTVTVAGYEGVVVGGVPTAGYPIYSYSGLPPGCTSANSSRIVCSPSQQGPFTVTATVSDPTGNSTTLPLSLLVNPAVQPDLYVAMNSSVEVLPTSDSICSTTNNSPFYSSTCYPQAQDPSVVPLPNAITGLGYGVYTTETNNTCAGASANTNSRVAFGLSKNNGTTFYHTVYLGGVTCASLNAIEPSFGANALGDVYGVFIMESSSSLPNDYGIRTGDALGFVSSLSGGLTFSAVTTLDGSGNLARPAIAVSGTDIYVVYEEIANSTVIPGGVLPIALKFIASTDGGTSWSTPITLPGLNKTSDWNAMSPSIAVSATGEIAVAYATNRSCVDYSGAPSKVSTVCLHYGSQVVVTTSTTNGVSWSGLSVASTGVLENPVTNTTGSFLGESTCYAGVCQPFFFQSSPSTSVSFSPTGTKLFVAWSGTINNTATVLPGLSWRWSAVGVSGTSNNGASWTGGIVAAPNWGGFTSLTGNRSNYYRPAIGVEGSELYLSYSEDNETNTTSGVGLLYPGPFDNSISQWADEATVSSLGTSAALTWASAAPITWTFVPSGRLTNFTGGSFTGYESSIAFSSYGVPLIGYSLPQTPATNVVSVPGYYSQNTTYVSSLTIAALGQPGWSQVIGLTILEDGLSSGSSWSIEIDYQVIQSTTTSILVVNVPEGITVFQDLLPLNGGNTWGERISQTYVPPTAVYYSATTLSLFYSVLYYFNESNAPSYSPTGTYACSSSYCLNEPEIYNYIYECVPIPGYTCSTPSAVNTTAGYDTECGYTSQVGCYYLEFEDDNITEIEPTFYLSEVLDFEYLYTYSSTLGYYEAAYIANEDICEGSSLSAGCNLDNYTTYPWCSAPFALEDIGTDCTVDATVGIWLPGGFVIAPSEEYYYTNYASGVAEIPDYFNGTGAGSFDGTVNICDSSTFCPDVYYSYFYYAVEDAFICYDDYPESLCATGGLITIENPINETVWNLPATGPKGSVPGYPLEVEPQGLSSGTPYSFDLGSTPYTATAPNPVLIDSIPPGVVQLTNGSAPGSPAGWEYYAPPLTVTIPSDVIVDLTFTSLVDLSAPARTISIHALNLTAGIAWGTEFNGSLYTSAIPYINTSARPGYYGVDAWEVNSTNGNTEFAPQNPASVDFATQTEYNLSFEPSYRVGVSSSSGGTVQLGTGKAGPGANAYYHSGVTVTITATPASGYVFLGFTGTGVGSYTGMGTVSGSQYTASLTVNGPISEVAAYGLEPAERYSITFVSKELPAGVWWTASLDGVEYSTNATTLTVTGLYVHNAPGGIGTYKFAVGDAYQNGTNGTRYVPGGYPQSVWANATGVTTYGITWATQYQVTLATTPGGTVSGSSGTLRVAAGSFWAGSNSTVAAIATKETDYEFLGWNGTGAGSVTSTATSIQFPVTSSETEVALFEKIPYVQPPEYTVDFELATAVEPGTTWTLTVANTTESWQISSVTSSLNATGLNSGTYTLKTAIAYGPDGLTRYVAQAPPSTVTVAGQNVTERLSYATQYWVSIESSALGTVSATQGSTNSAASLSGWYGARTVLVLTANATGNALFVGWIGNGTASSGAYTGPQPSQAITVTGPIREVAEFEPPAPASTSSEGFFSTTPSWLILAAVGFIVGIVLGLLLFRRKSGGSQSVTITKETDSTSPNLYESADRESSEPSVSEVVDNPGADQ